jgi:hypothetical protein
VKRARRIRVQSPRTPTHAATELDSGIAATDRRDGFDATESLAALPVHPLSELDVSMTMRVLRFEAELESRSALDDPRLGLARAMRFLLIRASAYAPGDQAQDGSFEASVAYALRRFYGWAFRALDAAIQGEPVQPLSRAVQSLLHEVVEACASRGACDPLLARLKATIVDLAEAGRRFPTVRPSR